MGLEGQATELGFYPMWWKPLGFRAGGALWFNLHLYLTTGAR